MSRIWPANAAPIAGLAVLLAASLTVSTVKAAEPVHGNVANESGRHLANQQTAPRPQASRRSVDEPVFRSPGEREAASKQREAFSLALHEFAVAKAGAEQPGYFAIIRRGLDAYDAMNRQDRSRAMRERSAFAQLDATPDERDTSSDGQRITSMRLGIRANTGARVTHGWQTGPGEHEETVAITGNGQLCSGIALSPTTVLTAAHCACQLRLAVADGDNDRHKIVFSGRSTAPGVPAFRIDVAATRYLAVDRNGPHPCPGNVVSNAALIASVRAGFPDMAVIRLQPGNVLPEPRIKVADPAVFDAAVTTSDFFVIGFGCTSPVQPEGPFLRCNWHATGTKTAGIIRDSARCVHSSSSTSFRCGRGWEFVLKDSGDGPLTDTCAGDSGGPVILYAPVGNTSRPFLVGITSRSYDRSGNCGFGGIYGMAATTLVRDWLASVGVAP